MASSTATSRCGVSSSLRYGRRGGRGGGLTERRQVRRRATKLRRPVEARHAIHVEVAYLRSLVGDSRWSRAWDGSRAQRRRACGRRREGGGQLASMQMHGTAPSPPHPALPCQRCRQGPTSVRKALVSAAAEWGGAARGVSCSFSRGGVGPRADDGADGGCAATSQSPCAGWGGGLGSRGLQYLQGGPTCSTARVHPAQMCHMWRRGATALARCTRIPAAARTSSSSSGSAGTVIVAARDADRGGGQVERLGCGRGSLEGL